MQLTLTSEELGGVGGVLPGASGAPEGSGTVDLWVQKDDLRPAKLGLALDLEEMGNVNVTVAFSAYDVPVTIEAPPADQVEAGNPPPSQHLDPLGLRPGRVVSSCRVAGAGRAPPPPVLPPEPDHALRAAGARRPVAAPRRRPVRAGA